MTNNYWANRDLKARERLASRGIKAVNKQLRKYYFSSMQKIIGQFEATYNKVLSNLDEGKKPTVADLYKLDKYWQMQGQLKQELQKLGDNQVSLLSAKFVDIYSAIYQSIAIKGEKAFSQIDRAAALQVINQIWCADGKSWSQRIWDNTDVLQATLNETLIECVVTGRKSSDLTKLLQERFDVSYNRASRLVRTEVANIQTQAAKKRYQDYGLEKYEILGNEDDSCGNHAVDCHKMHGKTFYYNEMVVGKNAPPFHPNCKCAIIPVVE